MSVTATDGTLLDIDSLPQILGRNGDGTVSYIDVALGDVTYRQTLTYAAGAVTAVSQWVKQ